MSLTDEELVSAYRRGEQEAMEELIGRYLRPIYVFVRRLTNDSPDAEDIAQTAFLKAWRHLGKFDESRRFRPWMFRIAKNAAMDRLRQRQPELFSSFESESGLNPVLDSLTDGAPLPDEILDRKESALAVDGLLREMPGIYREVLLLRHGEGFSFPEIAEVLATPLNTVKSRHRRGLAWLNSEILRQGPDASVLRAQCTESGENRV